MALVDVDGLGGCNPMAGQLAHPCARPIATQSFEGLGHLPVRPGPAVGTQVFVQRVLDQGVGEVVATRRVGFLTNEGRGRGASRMSRSSSSAVSVARASKSRSKSRPITAAIESTRPASLPRRTTRAPITSRTQSGRAVGVEGVLGYPAPCGVLVDGPRLDQVAQHLAHEERVAVGLAVDGMGEPHPGIVESVPGCRPP